MKTLTEFFGMSLKTIAEKIPAIKEELKTSVPEQLKADGKTEEEITAGLEEALKAALLAKVGEMQKIEGDKLTMLFNALDVASKARGNVKRVLVQVPMTEAEKAPSTLKEIDGKFYSVELFPDGKAAAPQKEDDRFGGRGKGRGGRDGKRDGGRGRGEGNRGEGRGEGSGGRGRPEGDRPARREPAEGATVIGVTAGSKGPLPAGHVAVPGGGRGPRAPKAPRAPAEPYKGPNRIVLAAGGSKPAESSAPAASEFPSTDGSSA